MGRKGGTQDEKDMSHHAEDTSDTSARLQYNLAHVEDATRWYHHLVSSDGSGFLLSITGQPQAIEDWP